MARLNLTRTKAILCDGDNTLWDPNGIHREVWKAWTPQFGLPEVPFVNGTAPEMRLQRWLESLPPQERELHSDNAQRCLDSMDESVLLYPDLIHQVELYPDTVRFLQRTHGTLRAIATNSGQPFLDLLSPHLDLNRWFQTIVTRTDVSNPKPDPESVLRALSQLGGISPSESVFIGDTLPDVQAARGAGIEQIIHLTRGLEVPNAISKLGAEGRVQILNTLDDVQIA